MTRISEVSEASLPAELRDLYKKFTGPKVDFTNQVRVMAHSPEAFLHLYGLIDAWNLSSTLSRRLVEIAVVTTSRVNDCAYCVGHHGATLIDLGLTRETVEGILDPEPPGLDERERLVRDYARVVTERAWGIRDKVFDDLKRHFNEREIVELTIRVGICALFNKLNQALQIEIEPGAAADAGAKDIEFGAPQNNDAE